MIDACSNVIQEDNGQYGHIHSINQHYTMYNICIIYMLSIPVFTFIECVKRLDMRLLRRHGSGRLSTASTSARVL